MKEKGPPGPIGMTVLAVLAAGMFFCGVDAILSDSVTTPSKFGDNHRVYGVDTVYIGIGWLLMGAALTAKLALSRRNNQAGSVVAVAIAAIGGIFWLVGV